MPEIIEYACGCRSVNGSRYFNCQAAKNMDAELTAQVLLTGRGVMLSESPGYMARLLWFDEHFADWSRADT